MLPDLEVAEKLTVGKSNRLLIISEGFESRSLSWITSQDETKLFSASIICKYDPASRDHFSTMYNAVFSRTKQPPLVVSYNRFDPSVFEFNFNSKFSEIEPEIDEIVIDISAMSKLLIMIILFSIKRTNCKVRLIYTEPETWSPSLEEYTKYIESQRTSVGLFGLSSVGVYDIIRTPNLSSIVMQDSPSHLITFTSTNEHLISVILNQVTPTKTTLINASSGREPWRERAAIELCSNILNAFSIDRDNIVSFPLLDYTDVFELIAKEYKKYCYSKRIVLAPIGGKIHTVACALIKICCPDIHVEYPTPESYVFDKYSSEETHQIYQIVFQSFNDFLVNLSYTYELNG